MKLSSGVEQAIHSVAMLASLSNEQALSAAALAQFHGVSNSYLLKHLQALSKAGVLASAPGPNGGYYLAKPASEISLLDIVLAVEGAQPAFRCQEIRRNGPTPAPDQHFNAPCQINAAMLRAEQAYRAELRKTTIAQLLAQFSKDDDGTLTARNCAFLQANARNIGSTDT